MGKNRKKGSRAFTPAVSAEKNNQTVSTFISSIYDNSISETIKLGSVNKSLGDARWEVSFYSKDKRGNTVEHNVQCIKAGNLSRRGVFISTSSIVIIDDIGNNLYQIIGVLSKDDIREFKKIDSNIFWVPERLFNSEAVEDDDKEDIIFEQHEEEEKEEVEEIKPQKVAYKRKNIINKDVVVFDDNNDNDIDIDDI